MNPGTSASMAAPIRRRRSACVGCVQEDAAYYTAAEIDEVWQQCPATCRKNSDETCDDYVKDIAAEKLGGSSGLDSAMGSLGNLNPFSSSTATLQVPCPSTLLATPAWQYVWRECRHRSRSSALRQQQAPLFSFSRADQCSVNSRPSATHAATV